MFKTTLKIWFLSILVGDVLNNLNCLIDLINSDNFQTFKFRKSQV